MEQVDSGRAAVNHFFVVYGEAVGAELNVLETNDVRFTIIGTNSRHFGCRGWRKQRGRPRLKVRHVVRLVLLRRAPP